MVFTAIQVEGAETIMNGVFLQVQPDLSAGAPWSKTADVT